MRPPVTNETMFPLLAGWFGSAYLLFELGVHGVRQLAVWICACPLGMCAFVQVLVEEAFASFEFALVCFCAQPGFVKARKDEWCGLREFKFAGFPTGFTEIVFELLTGGVRVSGGGITGV
jgi:hypothetical protein